MSRKTPYGRLASGKSQSGAMRMVPSHGMAVHGPAEGPGGGRRALERRSGAAPRFAGAARAAQGECGTQRRVTEFGPATRRTRGSERSDVPVDDIHRSLSSLHIQTATRCKCNCDPSCFCRCDARDPQTWLH